MFFSKNVHSYRPSLFNVHADAPRGAIGLMFGLSFFLLLYFVYASSEGSDESAHMRRLV